LKFVKANIAQNRVAFSTVSVAYILGWAKDFLQRHL
jgi:hypothetical protein